MSSVAATPLDFRSLSHTQTRPPILLLRPKGRGLRRAHPRLSNTTLSLDGLPLDAATIPSASTTTVAAPLEGPPVKGPHHRGRPSKALINREMCVYACVFMRARGVSLASPSCPLCYPSKRALDERTGTEGITRRWGSRYHARTAIQRPERAAVSRRDRAHPLEAGRTR